MALSIPTMTTQSIELRPIEALIPYQGNARTHSRAQIKQIAASITAFGFVNPILVDAHDQVIAGHGRLAAAKHLGLTEVPVLPVTHLSSAEKRAYILADNRLAEKAGWDRDILAIELQALIEFDFEVELTGFAIAEIDVILDDARERGGGATGDAADDVPAVPSGPAITKLGDLWQLGPHRLICGDARDANALGALLGNQPVDLIFTDPPYNVAIEGHVSGLGRVKHREFAMASGEMTEVEFIDFLTAALAPAAALCR